MGTVEKVRAEGGADEGETEGISGATATVAVEGKEEREKIFSLGASREVDLPATVVLRGWLAGWRAGG